MPNERSLAVLAQKKSTLERLKINRIPAEHEKSGVNYSAA